MGADLAYIIDKIQKYGNRPKCGIDAYYNLSRISKLMNIRHWKHTIEI